MIELIENTLQILAKVTKSRTAFLLKLNNVDTKVLTYVGYNPEGFSQFNSTLTELHKKSIIDSQSVENLPACRSVINELNTLSCYVRDMYFIDDKNEAVYLILFSDEPYLFIDSDNDVCNSILNILSNQVREYYQMNKGAETVHTISENENDKDVIIKNWEDNFNKLLSMSNDFIFILDKNGSFVKVNASGSLILDYTEKEMLGKHFLGFVASGKDVDISTAFNNMLHSDKTTTIRTELKSKLGKEIAVEITGKTIIRKGKVVGMLGMGRDISKISKYEDEIKKLKPKLIEAERLISIERARMWQQDSLIEELDRLKSEFVSNISHEFRTPLASIIGFSETIVSDPDLPEEMKAEFNLVILNEGKRLAKLINDVLDLSKMEDGKITLNKISFDVVALLNEVVNDNLESAKEKQITLDFEYPNETVFIDADKEKLAQTFEALINNAIKFTNEDGRVKVLVNNLFKEVEIIISDTGVGIPEKDLPYIFQKFYRVSRPGTEIPGTGIGLVFVKQIVDLHKGLISVQSELGKGTTFIVKLLKSFRVKKIEDEI